MEARMELNQDFCRIVSFKSFSFDGDCCDSWLEFPEHKKIALKVLQQPALLPTTYVSQRKDFYA